MTHKASSNIRNISLNDGRTFPGMVGLYSTNVPIINADHVVNSGDGCRVDIERMYRDRITWLEVCRRRTTDTSA